MRDNDNAYANGFDEVVKDHGASVRLTAVLAPNENAYIERFVQSIKQECLDHLLVFGEKPRDYLNYVISGCCAGRFRLVEKIDIFSDIFNHSRNLIQP